MTVFQSPGDQQVQPHHSHILPASREDPEGETREGGPDPLLQPQQHQGPVQVEKSKILQKHSQSKITRYSNSDPHPLQI